MSFYHRTRRAYSLELNPSAPVGLLAVDIGYNFEERYGNKV